MRRWFQLRLRTALVLMTVLTLPCAWLGANVRQWQAERGALAAIGPAQVHHATRPYLAIFG